MLPDFPRLRRVVSENVRRQLRLRTLKQQPLMARTGKYVQHEGHFVTLEQVGGGIQTIRYKTIQSTVRIPTEAITKGDSRQLENALDSIAEEFAGQQSKMMFGLMDRVTKQTGNVVDAKGRPFSQDLYLEMLEKVQVDFDAHGRPLLPTLVVGNDLRERVATQIDKWFQDSEFRKAFNSLLERKREDWRDREGDRTLVD